MDEPLYRRLPAFLIATVDKFAGLPFVDKVGAFFDHVDREERGKVEALGMQVVETATVMKDRAARATLAGDVLRALGL